MIHLVVALEAEARPLVVALRLRPRSDPSPPTVFEGDRCRLVVSGVGKVAAAAAVARLQALDAPSPAGWLNVGVGAHRTLPIGQPALASEVVDAETGRSWTLSPPETPQVPAVSVCTVDRPQSSIDDDRLYEMEAAGFVSRALGMASSESVVCLKIVSDRGVDSARALSRREVADLVARGLPTVGSVIDSLVARAAATGPQ